MIDLLHRAGIGRAPGGPLKELWAQALHQAQTESFADVYVIIMACFIIATVMVPLMQKVAAPKAPPAGAH